MDRWIPITQYAIEEGVSVSTLRRKIKSNSIEYRLDNGRYLIHSNASPKADAGTAVFAAQASDMNEARQDRVGTVMVASGRDHGPEIAKLNREMRESLAEMDLKWRAIEARLNGLAKKVDYLIEQNSELNMLVKVFEEKLNGSL